MKVSRYERNEVDESLSDTTHVALETTVKYSGKTPSSILEMISHMASSASGTWVAMSFPFSRPSVGGILFCALQQ